MVAFLLPVIAPVPGHDLAFSVDFDCPPASIRAVVAAVAGRSVQTVLRFGLGSA